MIEKEGIEETRRKKNGEDRIEEFAEEILREEEGN